MVAKIRTMTSRVHLCIALTLFSLISLCGGDDWLQRCGNCYCNWSSGKKAADCKNKSLTTIPTDLSSEMQLVDFSNNMIPEIRRSEFLEANLENLHKIFMRNCTLQEISKEGLKGLTILIELDLSNNLIHTLHAGTFNDLIRLRKLFVNNNNIEVLEDYLFKDLQHLHRVEFRNNRIKRIEVNVFANAFNVSNIYLEGNQLSTLKPKTFENMLKLMDLNLAENPWNCTCELQQFRDFSFSRRLYTSPTNCQNPPHLQGKLWSEIPSGDFACRPRIMQPRAGASVDASSENITLSCRIRAAPKPDVFWIYNKRPINLNDQRLSQRNSIETHAGAAGSKSPASANDFWISELYIQNVKVSDKGTYTCVARNSGGKDEADIQMTVNAIRSLSGAGMDDSSSNLLLIICIIAIVLLTLLIIVIAILCWYCRRIKKYTKDSSMSENGLISSSKMMDKSQNGSMLEGSVIMEMQKGLLTDVNPVEKPPRRTELEAVDSDDGHEIKKTLLYETPMGSHDEETNSVALSDTTPRSRQTFVDDGYGTNLPPDLLSFPARVPQSPSLQSSMSNLPDNRIYGKSPLSSPVYQHLPASVATQHGIYGTTPATFRTLQHPKSRNNMATLPLTRQNQSPFLPAPVIYPPVVMKQGYMTIPRKPRVPSWAPSGSTTLSEFQSPTASTASTVTAGNGSTSTEIVEPVYDNLGLRTTAGGNSLLNLNKIGTPSVRYTMKDRPLPATPNTTTSSLTNGTANSPNGTLSKLATNHQHSKIYEPINELVAINQSITSDTEPLYGQARLNPGVTIVPSDKVSKIPPRPPPKPKKKISVTANGNGGSTSQLFEDEGEDGTEV